MAFHSVPNVEMTPEVVKMTDQVEEVAAPEVVDTEATQETVETPTPETELGEDDKETQAVEKTYTQKEYDEATAKIRKKAEAVAERRALKVYAEKLESLNVKPAQQQEVKADNGKPQLSKYENVEDYVEAVADWKLNQREQGLQQEKAAKQQSEVSVKVQRILEDAEKIPGFDRDEFASLPVSSSMAEAIMDSDKAPQVVAYLASNPDDAERINKLSPARQAAEIGKLEVALSTVTKVKASSAPAPIKPLGSRGSATGTLADAKSMDEYEAMRRKQGAKWNRR